MGYITIRVLGKENKVFGEHIQVDFGYRYDKSTNFDVYRMDIAEKKRQEFREDIRKLKEKAEQDFMRYVWGLRKLPVDIIHSYVVKEKSHFYGNGAEHL